MTGQDRIGQDRLGQVRLGCDDLGVFAIFDFLVIFHFFYVFTLFDALDFDAFFLPFIHENK